MMHRDDARLITVGVADDERGALAFAAEEARLSGCDLQTVHAYTIPPAPPDAVGAAYGVDIDGTFREDGRARLADASAVLAATHAEVVVHPLLERGGAARVLATVSASSSLMVLGPDDGTPWYGRLFQSRVARRLVEAADCPVVVVPDSWEPTTRARGITLLLDSETIAHGPLRFTFDHAALHQEAVHVVHLRSEGETHEGAVSWHEMSRLVQAWNARYPVVVTDVRIVGGAADAETVSSLQNTGLLVLGRPHETHTWALLHASLAQAVIEHAECPVAVVSADYDG